MSRKLSQLNFSYVDCTPLVPKSLVPKVFFPVPGILALVLNMDISQGSGSRLYFGETLLQPAACPLKFCKGSLWGIFKKITINFSSARF